MFRVYFRFYFPSLPTETRMNKTRKKQATLREYTKFGDLRIRSGHEIGEKKSSERVTNPWALRLTDRLFFPFIIIFFRGRQVYFLSASLP